MKYFQIAVIALVGVWFSGDIGIWRVEAASRSCTNLFSCMPYLFTIPFKEIVNASYYYTGSLMRLSQISDEDWDKQMTLLTGLCDTWLNFDSCMDKDWIECIDWNQLSSMVELVGQTSADPQTGQDSAAASAARQKGLNRTRETLSKVGWTMADTRKAMKIGSHLCQNVRNVVPYMSCMRDLLLSNETLINITLWFNGIGRAGCGQTDITCDKVEKLNKMYGHWLYHGCEQGTEALSEVVRAIFQGMMFSDDEDCVDIFKGKSAKDLYEPMYDKRTEVDFGNDLSKCNLTKVGVERDAVYKKYITDYFVTQNTTREAFYHKVACKHKKIPIDQCDIWPVPTTPRPDVTPRPNGPAPRPMAPAPAVDMPVRQPGVPARPVANLQAEPETTTIASRRRLGKTTKGYDDSSSAQTIKLSFAGLLVSLFLGVKLAVN